jgi:putative ABC transport system permease protein
MDTLIQDVRGGLRMLAARPLFTAVAVITLALGIGANTTIFSVVHAVLLRPLPYQEPERLVFLWNSIPSANVSSFPLSPAEYVHYREHNEAFEDLAVSQARSYNLIGRELPERIPGALVSRNLFPLLGVEAEVGRAFVTDDESSEDDGSVVISYGLWNRLFRAAPEVVGETIIVNDVPRTVIGVMPRGFDFPGQADIWVPAVFTPEQLGRDGLGQQFVRALARLKRDTSLFEAQEVMDWTARQLHRQYADFYEDGNPWKVTLAPMHEHITGSIRTPLAVLLGAVALVLLVACANVSSLLLTRAAARQGELAVRAALGAGTHRLVRMLLTEGVLLALLGGGAALLVAYFGIGAVRALAPEGVPRLDEVNIDGRVLAFTLGVSIVVGLLLAILPAFQSVRFDLQQGIKLGVHAATVRSRRRARSILVVAELALALILTIGAGLLTKSFLLLSQVEPGFQPENVLTFEISLSPLKYRDAREASTFHLNAIRQIEALPGVLSAGGVSTLPLGGRDNRAAFTVEGEADPDVRETAVHYRLVSPGYFRAMGIPLLRGRTLSETDDASAPLVLVINQTMARLLWPDSDPIGRRINFGGPDDGDWYRVVGVVGDVKHFGLDAQPEIEVFMTYAQASFQSGVASRRSIRISRCTTSGRCRRFFRAPSRLNASTS